MKAFAFNEQERRQLDLLSGAFGDEIQSLLNDPDVIELMLNPDGRLWQDRIVDGCSDTGITVSPSESEMIIRIVASKRNEICNAENPIISAELPGAGYRFQGMLPPVVENPVFTIRKKASRVFSLDDFVDQGVIERTDADLLKRAVGEKKNILVAGGTGSGKTTFVNALLKEIAKTKDRLVIIEDTVELQCDVPNHTALRTSEGAADMRALLKATMRLRPDRIIVGEVRGGEALDLLKAWNTGHPGGVATVHANSAKQSLTRLEQLALESVRSISRQMIADTVNIIVFIERKGKGRKVLEIVDVSYNGEYVFKSLLSSAAT
jgi:type IV secretion system protein VirB11